jgi:Chain length determinant protein
MQQRRQLLDVMKSKVVLGRLVVKDEERSLRKYDDGEVSLLDYWRVVRKHLRLIVVLYVIAVLASMGYSLWTPKIYEATATLLTPDERVGRSRGWRPRLRPRSSHKRFRGARFLR